MHFILLKQNDLFLRKSSRKLTSSIWVPPVLLFVDLCLSSNGAHFMPRPLKSNKTRPILQFQFQLHVSSNIFSCFVFIFWNLFISEEKQRQMQKQKHRTCIYNLRRQKTLNLQKQTFSNTALQFYTPWTVSNGYHFLHIYSFCVGNKKFMVVFSILIQYFRYLDLHLYWVYHLNIYIYINNTLK